MNSSSREALHHGSGLFAARDARVQMPSVANAVAAGAAAAAMIVQSLTARAHDLAPAV